MRTDGQTKLTVAFRNFVNAPEISVTLSSRQTARVLQTEMLSEWGAFMSYVEVPGTKDRRFASGLEFSWIRTVELAGSNLSLQTYEWRQGPLGLTATP